jgi:hypothetical protein
MPDPATDDVLKPLNREVEEVQIANFDGIQAHMNARYRGSSNRQTSTFHKNESTIGSRAGDVRVDKRVFTKGEYSGVALYSEFNKASLVKEIKASVAVQKEPPQEYSASAYFKKGFVHEVDADRPNGGATLSATLGATFDAPEDGRDFVQADIDKMVKMAIETDGFEIALDFNTDQDGGDVVYSAAYLDANGGKIRSVLEAELNGTGIDFEGRNANDVLADYRGYVVEKAVEVSAKNHFSSTLSGHELDEAVEGFMERKFDKNADKISYGDENATLEGHDQGERAVNLMFHEIESEHEHDHEHEHTTSDAKHNHNSGNHTHMIWAVDKSDQKGFLSVHVKHGQEADEGNVVFVDARDNQERIKNLSNLTEEQSREQALRVRFKGNITNRTIDNNKIIYNVDGEITSEYNAERDCIDVKVDGNLYSIVEWPDARELIDPARLKIGHADSHGKGSVSVAQNIDPALSEHRRDLAGITPMTDAVEEAVRITTDCKNLYLLSDGDKEAYKNLLAENGIEERLNNLGAHYEAYAGVDMGDRISSLKAQYVNTEHSNFAPWAIRDDDTIATEIAVAHPELGVDPSSGSVVNAVSALYKEPIIAGSMDEAKSLGNDSLAMVEPSGPN